ncbi:valine--tRNA ligase [Patescibacteria group bacterium]|nr:valine--tRNA ligase [Patescibacteria group bacterium]
MIKELEKAYQPQDIEKRIYKIWEKSGYFNPDKLPGKRKQIFSIAMPPPNVTGELHLGHATAITLEDIMARYHRMAGDKTLYLPGTDHAGISTQVMVERLISKSGLSKHKLGRVEFIKRVWDWKKKYGSRITEQIRQLGASCDWSREHFTMDPTLTKAVQAAFIKMFNDGLIYRGKRIVNWCPRCSSALSDLEVKHQETSSKLWYLKYPLFGSTKYLIVATTRPETMLGDTAVAVNPNDKRYKSYINTKALLPITNREVPIIADKRVDMNFGTGAVKVTPAHDHLDYEIAQDHKLEIINVIGPDNRMTKQAGEFYGQSVQDARHNILKRLEQEELLDNTVDYIHNLARCERCSAPIEPLISEQWFVRIDKLAKPAIKAVKSGKIKIIPARYEKVYFHWMNNIKDWCISRQLWWGHQIPVWYCGQQYEASKKIMGFHKDVVPQVCAGKIKTYRLRDHGFKPGDKISFESSQTGKIFGIGTITSIKRVTVGAIQLDDPAHGTTYKKRSGLIAAFKRHHPDQSINDDTKVFIYTYIFNPSAKTEGCGEIIAAVGQPKKCPKCKQTNHIRRDPDTLDTWFSSGLWTFSTLGWPEKTQDLKTYHPTTVMETGWDILFFWVARMIMMSQYFMKEVPFKYIYLHGLVLDRHGKKMSKSKGTGVDPIPMMEKYGTDAIRLSLILGTSPGQDFRLYEEKIASYRNFINKLWNVSRFILSQDAAPPKKLAINSTADQWIVSRLQQLINSTTENINHHRFSEAGLALYDFLWHELADWYIEITKTEKNISVLYYVLEYFLKLTHPLIPYVTEEIWMRWKGEARSNMLMIQPWPQADKKFIDKKIEKNFFLLKDFTVVVRNFRAKHKIPAGEKIHVYYWGPQSSLINDNSEIIKLLAKIESLNNEQQKKLTGSLPGLDYYIDWQQDNKQKDKEVEKISKYIQKLEGKLSNKEFTKKAPKQVVEQEKAKLAEQQEKLQKLL